MLVYRRLLEELFLSPLCIGKSCLAYTSDSSVPSPVTVIFRRYATTQPLQSITATHLLQSPLFCICISKLCLVILVCVHNCSSLNVLHLALARTLRPAHGKHVLGSLEVLTSPRKPQPLAEEWVWHQVATFSDIAQVLMPERQPTSLCELSIPICTTSYQKDGNLKDFLILLYMYISYYIYMHIQSVRVQTNHTAESHLEILLLMTMILEPNHMLSQEGRRLLQLPQDLPSNLPSNILLWFLENQLRCLSCNSCIWIILNPHVESTCGHLCDSFFQCSNVAMLLRRVHDVGR